MSYGLNETLARKVLETVDAGLVSGLGAPTPGSMCVEAAVCYAMGLPHSDKPTCVGSAVRAFKIRINDARWSSDKARTEGLRRLAVAQLGSDSIDQQEFVRIVVEQTIRQIVPRALRTAKLRDPKHAYELEEAATRCEQNGDHEAALNAKSVARTCAAATVAYATADADAYAYAYAAYADAANATAADVYAYAYAYAYAATAATYAANATAATAADVYAYAYATAAAAAANAAYAYAAAADTDVYAYATAATAYAAYAYAAAAADTAAARDEVLSLACSIALNALIELQSPGCQFLHLCDAGA